MKANVSPVQRAEESASAVVSPMLTLIHFVKLLSLSQPSSLELGALKKILPGCLKKSHVVCDVIAGEVVFFDHSLKSRKGGRDEQTGCPWVG